MDFRRNNKATPKLIERRLKIKTNKLEEKVLKSDQGKQQNCNICRNFLSKNLTDLVKKYSMPSQFLHGSLKFIVDKTVDN